MLLIITALYLQILDSASVSELSASENKDKICIIHRKIIILQT